MKALLEFQLPDDQSDYIVAVHAMDWYLTAWDIDQDLRRWLKYGHKFESADEALEGVRERLWSIMEERGISMDMGG